ncbi:MAG: HAMP domain-containing histidine kinase [Bacteroidetes bacterium]|mgnify:CR=1 FL=1|jgi:two-component system, OmpR family, phosphate regulon sensor histidine kinase PhoR|nr:HAMP domain-containing histidine kinase [Bacteroidota bacterium]MBT3749293.1 HAMP domain-containing histidine kinase [Bacteroidota bacterium]MBT4398246.1 HAMP domain-containing histidine kinase [Bacteroidota bacterium]MBT4409031.1 HAMP domain-containing histidine kinase [Bacteroidota bacterium]MBT5427843.1 HAMP domain-containing histidine kinase [Bacteroidota bacterium]
MKNKRIQLTLLLLALTCLVALTGIQMNWVLSEAKHQKEEFDKNVKQALRSIEKNTQTVKDCPAPNKTSGSCNLLLKSINDAFDLDSLIKNDLSRHGIDLDYEYGIVNVNLDNYRGAKSSKTVTANLAESLNDSGYELLINFPKKRDFIQAQMGNTFISSIILIILLMVSFILIFRLYNREKEFSRQIKDFVNNMAHEFKTPLTNISFATNMVAKNNIVKADEKLSSLTQIIKTEQSKLHERLEKVLSSFDRTKVDSDDLVSANLRTITEAVIGIYEDQIKEKKGLLDYSFDGQDFNCFCDEDSIHIILSNLMDNAIKYSGENPQIAITIQATEQLFSLEVADQGPGIPKKHHNRIFEQYYRVPKGDIYDAKGFGIGLYHVKQIADQLEGSIKLISSPNRGSRFIVEWPRKDIV